MRLNAGKRNLRDFSREAFSSQLLQREFALSLQNKTKCKGNCCWKESWMAFQSSTKGGFSLHSLDYRLKRP